MTEYFESHNHFPLHRIAHRRRVRSYGPKGHWVFDPKKEITHPDMLEDYDADNERLAEILRRALPSDIWEACTGTQVNYRESPRTTTTSLINVMQTDGNTILGMIFKKYVMHHVRQEAAIISSVKATAKEITFNDPVTKLEKATAPALKEALNYGLTSESGGVETHTMKKQGNANHTTPRSTPMMMAVWHPIGMHTKPDSMAEANSNGHDHGSSGSLRARALMMMDGATEPAKAKAKAAEKGSAPEDTAGSDSSRVHSRERIDMMIDEVIVAANEIVATTMIDEMNESDGMTGLTVPEIVRSVRATTITTGQAQPDMHDHENRGRSGKKGHTR